MNSCKPSSGLPCPAARLSAAANPTASIISGHSRPLLVAAGGGGSGGGGGTSRQRQVGLPEDQLVFSFLTTPEAAAAARRQLRPELPYGPSALKLATLQGDKVQAILDRWQYAVAQRELDSLDARPMLWWRYESALKGAGGGSDTGNGGSGSGSSRWYTGSSRGAATGSFADDPAAEAAAESDEAVFSKRQLRRMARAAKAAAKAAGRPQQAPPASDRAACKDGVAGSRKGADHSGGTSSNSASGSGSGSAAQQEPAGLIIDQSAFEPAWQVCTLRGLPDGTTIYKFSDEFEPVVIGPEAAPADGGAAAVEAAEAAAVAAAAGSGDAAGGALVTGFTPDGPPAGEVGMWWRQEQRPELGRLLYVQEQQRSMEGVAWSSALRLGTRFSGHAKGALHKLQIFTTALARFCLAAYRLLPLPFRRLFWRNWPPQWPSHLIPAVRQLLLARRLGAAELQAAGFNADGHSVDPLADLQAWQVERLTGCHVRDLSLYRAALTHKSALPPELRVAQSYERLEFLGDAVLSLACRTLLMERCPTSDEGEMTKLGSLLVSGASNARYAAFLGLEHYLVLDPRTLREGGQHTPHILADVFEALLGALYLDAGWAAAHTFCRRVLSACVDWSQVEADAEDWKGVFSRLAYQQRRPQPRYRTTSTRKRQFRGGLQLKWYTVDVQYGGEVVGTGSGWERRWAEQAAARQALDNMGQMPGAAAAEGAAAVE
ncbi:ribonuclease III [Chlorella sorokiniana]|uniref:Ribonuclease III n=1 Tax=Chlorella sorokiniana TaxID=3076 RepID=A0A2P6U0I7_CHLSO|nr:ribonuclease III [Chlorella sorokiniana]|eukprot:PRW59825.1 ribonuclease III [Chlorella sorokiniana]